MLMDSNEPVPVNTIVFSEAEKQFQAECLTAHNRLRAKHGSPPLQLCDQLCSYATNWAYELAEIDQLQYSPTNTLGENLYMASGIRINGGTPVKAWYQEEADYDYKIAKFSPYTGHFTQLIWKGTRELGVGVVRTESGYIVVASYYPPGNERGAFRTNVLAPKNSNSNSSSNNQNANSEDNSTCYICSSIIFATVLILGAWIILKA